MRIVVGHLGEASPFWLLFVGTVIGPDHVLYAMDYPYQFVPEEVTVGDNWGPNKVVAFPAADVLLRRFVC